MKTLILAGGYGTRLLEETIVKPKPMVEIGGMPVLWHIMTIYAAFGFKEYLVALGYKGDWIKSYFLNRYRMRGDLTINLADGKIEGADQVQEDWLIHLIESGLNTSTGGRIIRLKDHLKNETFMMTYGDGVSNVNIKELVEFHKSHGKCVTVTAVRPPARFGVLTMEPDKTAVLDFGEKPQVSHGWINGGFFVMEPGVFDYLHDEKEPLEGLPLRQLAKDGQLEAYKHNGFWQCMDTLRDVQYLESLWTDNSAPWRVFE